MSLRSAAVSGRAARCRLVQHLVGGVPHNRACEDPASQQTEGGALVPDNRELATAILLLAFVIFALTIPGARKQIPNILRVAAPLAPLFAVYLAAASALIGVAWSIGLWSPDLWWSALIVVLGVGVGLMSSALKAKSVHALWEAVAARTAGVAIFLGFYTNLATFPLLVEIVIQALATFAAMVRVVADHQGEKLVRQFADVVLAVTGLALVARTTVVLAQGMPGDEWLHWLKRALLSIWFPFALIPLLYLVSYLSAVESAVVKVRFAQSRDPGKWPTIGRFLLALRLRLSLAAAFDHTWARRYADAEDSRARRRVLVRFRQVERLRFELSEPSMTPTLRSPASGQLDDSCIWDGRAMPRRPEHLAQMLDAKPPGWEWMAFGTQLWLGLAGLHDRYEAHRHGGARKGDAELHSKEALPYLSRSLEEGGRLPKLIDDIFEEVRQERAFGPPGEPGSVDEIRRMANEFISVYVTLMDWSDDVRGTRVPSRFRRSYDAAARLMDGPIEQLRHFVASLADELDVLAEHVASGSKEQLTITQTLALSIRPDDQVRFDRAMISLAN